MTLGNLTLIGENLLGEEKPGARSLQRCIRSSIKSDVFNGFKGVAFLEFW